MGLQKFTDLFILKTKKSEEIWRRACKYLPGGVAGNAAFLIPHPIYIDKAVGGKLIDVDGNEYIDLLLGGFPNILGHSPKPVVDAVRQQLDHGTDPMLFHEIGVKLAEKISKHMPHMEMIRFVNTGSEATASAIRVARAYTKRDKIAKIEGGWIGQHDYGLISSIGGIAGSDYEPLPIADFAGIPKFVVDNMVVLPFNDVEHTISIIKKHANELAAVILEPLACFGLGAIPADREYLKALREVTMEKDVLLIFDEIVTGFRVGGLGGAAKYYGVKPDLTALGKIVGGGFPIGAFGGRRDIMEKTCHPMADPEFKIFQSGTFSGNPISMTAGLAMLTELETKDYSYIDNLAGRIRTELPKIGVEYGFEMQVTGLCSLFYPHFNSKPIRNMRDRLKDYADRNYEFCLGLIVNGVYLPPRHPGAICFAHTKEDVDYVLETAEMVLRDMRSR
jgi:glutamate-1-semialdehyde 2,1-aminomutase